MEETFTAPDTVHRKEDWSVVRAMLHLGKKYRINLEEFERFYITDIGRSFACAFGNDGDMLYRLLFAMPHANDKFFFSDEFQGFDICTMYMEHFVSLSRFFYWMKMVGIYRDGYMVCYKDIDYVLLPFGSDT